MQATNKAIANLRLAYGSYDFSNSGYVAVFQSFLFPIVLAASLHSSSISSNAVWAVIVAASSIIAIAVAPSVGRLGDLVGKGRVFAGTVIASGVLAAAAAYLGVGLWPILVGAFLVFNTLFELSQSLYDSFLLDVETDDKGITSLSTFAWGFGYLGGAFFAIIYFALNAIHTAEPAMLSLFAVLYLVLSIPAMRVFSHLTPWRGSALKAISIRDLFKTASPVPRAQLLVYWIIADCVAGVMYFLPLFLKQELGFDMKVIGGLLLGGQLLAFPLTVMSGRIANRIGRVRAIRGALVIWGIGLVSLAFVHTLGGVIAVVILLAFVVGSTQSLLRANFAAGVDATRSGEGLGYYAVAQKSASIFAPALIGVLLYTTGTLRSGFAALAGVIIIALLASRGLATRRVNNAGAAA